MSFSYYIELRDTSGTFLDILEEDVFSIFWSYDSIGGCGDCEIGLRREFDNFGDIDLDYDVRIYRVTTPIIKTATVKRLGTGVAGDFTVPGLLAGDAGVRELRWRGFIREIDPVLDFKESVRLKCSGYSRQMEYISVPSLTRTSEDVGATARYIIDTYVTPGSQIKRTASLSQVENTGISISGTGLKFDTSAWEALKTLAEIGGNVEWGVRPGLNSASPEDNEIYFRVRSTTIKQTYAIGDRIKYYESRKTTDEVVRKVYLRGNAAFTATLTSGLGLEAGRYKERVVLVPSIANAADATLWGNAYFSLKESAQQKARLILGASDTWIENDPQGAAAMPPMGKLRILGGPIFVKYGGSVLPGALPFKLSGTIGATTDVSYRINSILYRPVGNSLQIEIDLGERRPTLADFVRGIEYKLSELRQVV